MKLSQLHHVIVTNANILQRNFITITGFWLTNRDKCIPPKGLFLLTMNVSAIYSLERLE